MKYYLIYSDSFLHTSGHVTLRAKTLFALECVCVWLEVSGKTSFISEATRLRVTCTRRLEDNIKAIPLTLTAQSQCLPK